MYKRQVPEPVREVGSAEMAMVGLAWVMVKFTLAVAP